MTSKEMTEKAEKANKEKIMTTEIAKALITDAEPRSTPAVIAAMENNRGQALRLYGTTSWEGSFFEDPPETFYAGETAQFEHTGSIGALIYGQELASSNAAGYLLAWSMGGSIGCRVYVKCGPISEMYYSGWESAARTSLNSSGVTSSSTDDRTSSSIQASNEDATGTFPLGVLTVVLS